MQISKTLRRLLRGRRATTVLLVSSAFVVLGASAMALAMHAERIMPPGHADAPKSSLSTRHVKALARRSTAHPSPSPTPTPTPTAAPAPAPVARPAAVPAPKPAADVAASPAAVASTGAAPGNGVSGLSSDTGSPPPAISPSPTPSPSPSPSPAPTPCTNTPGQYYSSNWAGYFKTGCTFTAVSGAWTAPTSTTTSTTDTTVDATWIGIGGVTGSDLIQVGTEETVDTDGTINAAVFYELLPDNPHYPDTITVSPGDRMSASVGETAPGTWRISISNLTTGKTFTKSVAYASSYSSAEWIEEDPSYSDGSLVPFDNFGTVTFTGASATGNGTVGNLADASSIKLVDNQSRTLASPSAVGGANSDSFSVTRLMQH